MALGTVTGGHSCLPQPLGLPLPDALYPALYSNLSPHHSVYSWHELLPEVTVYSSCVVLKANHCLVVTLFPTGFSVEWPEVKDTDLTYGIANRLVLGELEFCFGTQEIEHCPSISQGLFQANYEKSKLCPFLHLFYFVTAFFLALFNFSSFLVI